MLNWISLDLSSSDFKLDLGVLYAAEFYLPSIKNDCSYMVGRLRYRQPQRRIPLDDSGRPESRE
jgi:hypothetical protein